MGENTHTIEHLRELQALPLSMKIRMTEARLRDWINEWSEDGVYVSFSGGKDSTVLLDIARKNYPKIPAMYVDTGLEYPEIKEFVRSFENIDIVRPKMNFRKVIENFGYPVPSKELAAKIAGIQRGSAWALKFIDGSVKSQYSVSGRWRKLIDAPFKVSSYCCDVMKKSPAHIYSHKHDRKAITATTAEESRLRTQKWSQNGCNAFEAKNPVSNPMSFWTEQDILQYIAVNNLPICSVYGQIVDNGGKLKTTGCDRTGCVFCMFGCHMEQYPNRFQRLQVTHPKLYDYCMKPFDEGGLGIKTVLEYCDIPYSNEQHTQGQITFEDI